MQPALVDIEVIEERAAAAAALDPIRSEILTTLATPGSATTVANQLGLTRQKANYHLRALESHGLVRHVEDRKRRGLTERVMVASASSYLVSPSVLGEAATPDPARTDRLSTRYLLALAARMVQEVVELARGAERTGKPLATLAIDTEIRFASPEDRASFTTALVETVNDLVARYHDEASPAGRLHRLVIAAHPIAESHE